MKAKTIVDIDYEGFTKTIPSGTEFEIKHLGELYSGFTPTNEFGGTLLARRGSRRRSPINTYLQ